MQLAYSSDRAVGPMPTQVSFYLKTYVDQHIHVYMHLFIY